MSTFLRSPTVLACALAAAGLAAATPAHAEWIYGRLVPGPSTQTDHNSSNVDVSNDGKTVVFSSEATNWLPDTEYNNKAVAVDLDTGLVEVVSRTSAGAVLRGESPAVSRDGRYVAFLNYAQNLDLGFPTSNWQVVRKDRLTGVLALATANQAGDPVTGSANDDDTVSISGNGRYVAFESTSQIFGYPVPDGTTQIFVKDMDTGAVELASEASTGGASPNGCAIYPNALSDDGRFIVLLCNNALVPGAGTWQTYVRDLVANTTEVISRASGANGAPSSAFSNRAAISPSGRFVVFQNPTYGGLGGDPDTHSGIYMRDRVTQTTVSIPAPAVPGFGSCYESDVSDAGTVLMECSTNPTTNVYLHVPGVAGSPLLVSNGPGGVPGNGHSGYTLAMDASGLSMAFESNATNIDPDDTNESDDIFVLVDSDLLNRIFGDGFED